MKCAKCGKRSYSEFCMQHKPRKPILSRSKPLQTSKTVSKPSKPRKKRTDRQKAKDKAWETFSYYVRIRDSLKTTGTLEYCVCITCNERGDSTPKPFNKIQAGHAVGGRGNAVLFNEELVFGQCSYCNQKPPMGLGGDYGNYAIALARKYGIDKVAELQRLRHQTKVYKTHDFLEIIEIYKKKTADLLKNC